MTAREILELERTDIVERLRACLRFADPNVFESEIEHVAREAADEIDKLRAELAKERDNRRFADARGEEKRAENERLHAENDFLHKRRGDLVIERDRYKAALAEYPEGRDVLLGGALAEIENLRAELAKHQESEFHPDWSMLKATQNSLREHQKMIRERDAEIEGLRASYTAIIQWLRGQGLLVRYSMCTRPDNTLGPAWVLRRVHSVAGDSCLGWHDDDPVAAVEAALKVTR